MKLELMYGYKNALSQNFSGEFRDFELEIQTKGETVLKELLLPTDVKYICMDLNGKICAYSSEPIPWSPDDAWDATVEDATEWDVRDYDSNFADIAELTGYDIQKIVVAEINPKITKCKFKLKACKS